MIDRPGEGTANVAARLHVDLVASVVGHLEVWVQLQAARATLVVGLQLGEIRVQLILERRLEVLVGQPLGIDAHPAFQVDQWIVPHDFENLCDRELISRVHAGFPDQLVEAAAGGFQQRIATEVSHAGEEIVTAVRIQRGQAFQPTDAAAYLYVEGRVSARDFSLSILAEDRGNCRGQARRGTKKSSAI